MNEAFFRQEIYDEHIEIVGREKNELLDDLEFKPHDGPLKQVIKTRLPTVTWRKPLED